MSATDGLGSLNSVELLNVLLHKSANDRLNLLRFESPFIGAQDHSQSNRFATVFDTLTGILVDKTNLPDDAITAACVCFQLAPRSRRIHHNGDIVFHLR